MSFRIKKREKVSQAVRRIADEQLEKAIAEATDSELTNAERVHQIRKRCKKLRGLIRLVRPGFSDSYQSENAFFRNTARQLSVLRDADTMLATYDKLMIHFAEQVNRPAFASIRRQLTERCKHLKSAEVDEDQRLQTAKSALTEARQRVDSWCLDAKGYDSVMGGLTKTYGRARQAMQAAYAEPSAAAFHEWRKRVKYHWYHCRLLQNVWQPVLKQRRKQAGELSDLLGDQHDLAVLGQTIAAEPEQFGDERDVQVFTGLIQQRSQQLEDRSRKPGQRLYAEPADQFGQRLGCLWKVWRA